MSAKGENGLLDTLPVIDSGTVVQVNDSGGGIKYVSRFVGMDNQVIITRLPPVSQLNKSGMGTEDLTYRDTFHKKRKLIMRMIVNGQIFAFETEVIDLMLQGSKLLITTYPKAIQSRLLRKEPRYPCTLPTVLTSGEESLEGVLINLSSSGGLLQLTGEPELESLQALKSEQGEVSLNVTMPFDEQPVAIKAKVMSLAAPEYQVGLAFVDGKEAIQKYITTLKLDSIGDFF
ncbi:MAG: flagellar brake protein [Amphritea sp.]|nr:flagellar brake protein [Amphritea sp.]